MCCRGKSCSTLNSRTSLSTLKIHTRGGAGGFPAKCVAAATMPARFGVEIAELYQATIVLLYLLDTCLLDGLFRGKLSAFFSR